jgi:hypothetical protein
MINETRGGSISPTEPQERESMIRASDRKAMEFKEKGFHEKKRRRIPRPVAGDESAKSAELRSDES